jgi:hypothetical protein
MKIFLIFNIIISLVSFSCEKDTISGDVVFNPELVKELYKQSIDTLTFESNDYILQANLYRDFFPILPMPESRPLIASIFLVNTDSLLVSENLLIKKLYVINSNNIWIANLKDGKDNFVPDFKLDKLNAEGPEWDTGIFVDVILEIKNKLTLETYFLIARQQEIQKAS